MQEPLEGGPGSGSGATAGAGALPGEMAGLQIEDTVLMEVEVLLRAAGPAWLVDEDEEEEEPVLDTAGGVNWPLLSEPVLSRAGDDFFLGGRALAALPLCCCWRHLALRFLNHTCGQKRRQELATKPPPPQQQNNPDSHAGEGKLKVIIHQVHFHAAPRPGPGPVSVLETALGQQPIEFHHTVG